MFFENEIKLAFKDLKSDLKEIEVPFQLLGVLEWFQDSLDLVMGGFSELCEDYEAMGVNRLTRKGELYLNGYFDMLENTVKKFGQLVNFLSK